ncbi:hypothetical protein FQJ95_16630, partial [Xanthomonas vasicola]
MSFLPDHALGPHRAYVCVFRPTGSTACIAPPPRRSRTRAILTVLVVAGGLSAAHAATPARAAAS